MMEDKPICTSNYNIMPEESEWQCEICSGNVIVPFKGGEPNLIHRWLQKVILGFKWSKR